MTITIMVPQTLEEVDQSLADALKLREYALRRGSEKWLEEANLIIDEWLDLRLEKAL